MTNFEVYKVNNLVYLLDTTFLVPRLKTHFENLKLQNLQQTFLQVFT